MTRTIIPTNLLEGLDRNLGRFVGDLFEDLGVSRRSEAVTPRLDLFESPAGYAIEVDMPGVREEDVSLSIEDGLLDLRAERKREERGDEEVARYVERHPTMYARRLRLPGPVDEGRIEATLVDGVLKITLPKTAEAQPRKIQVRRQG